MLKVTRRIVSQKRFFCNFHSLQPARSRIIIDKVAAMNPAKTAGLIVIGDEVLKGQVEDKNIYFFGKKLKSLGIKLEKVSIIPDVLESIAKEVAQFSTSYDRVITTGGIGPTHDDLTYEGVALAFNDQLKLDKEMKEFWIWFERPSGSNGTTTTKLASIPSTSVVLYPIVKNLPTEKFPVVTVNNVIIFPGVPVYVQAIFNGLEGTYFVHSGIKFYNRRLYFNVWESILTDPLDNAVSKYGTNVTFGSYPKVNCPYYKVVITMESENEAVLSEAYEYLRKKVPEMFLEDEGGDLGDAWLSAEEAIADGKFNEFKDTFYESVKTLEDIFEKNSQNEIFLAFNGGKDCTALLHLTHLVLNKKYGLKGYPKLTLVYFKMKNPFEEAEKFVYDSAKRYNCNLIVENLSPKEGLHKLVKTDVGKLWKYCLLGVRSNDPTPTTKHVEKTDDGWPELIRVSPLLNWKYKDVWSFLRSLKVPYCQLYDQGYTSLDQATNTNRNPLLRYVNESGQEFYKPAYTLENNDAERLGRETK